MSRWPTPSADGNNATRTLAIFAFFRVHNFGLSLSTDLIFWHIVGRPRPIRTSHKTSKSMDLRGPFHSFEALQILSSNSNGALSHGSVGNQNYHIENHFWQLRQITTKHCNRWCWLRIWAQFFIKPVLQACADYRTLLPDIRNVFIFLRGNRHPGVN